MVADLLIPALETSTSNRCPTIERTSLASRVAPSGGPKRAWIPSARPLLRESRKPTIPRPARNGHSEPEHAPQLPQALMPWHDRFLVTRRSPAPFCLVVKPLIYPPSSRKLDFFRDCSPVWPPEAIVVPGRPSISPRSSLRQPQATRQ